MQSEGGENIYVTGLYSQTKKAFKKAAENAGKVRRGMQEAGRQAADTAKDAAQWAYEEIGLKDVVETANTLKEEGHKSATQSYKQVVDAANKKPPAAPPATAQTQPTQASNPYLVPAVV